MDDAAPPRSAPSYFSGGWFRLGSDEPQFRVHQTPEGSRFEFFGENEDDPAIAAQVYAEDLARHVAEIGIWTSSSGWRIETEALTTFGGARVVPFAATHPDGRAAHGTLRLQAHASNWVRADVFVEGIAVFTGFFDRVWEEFDIWPPGASGKGEAPARIGKRRNWVGIDITAWPALEPFAHDGGIIILEGDEVP